ASPRRRGSGSGGEEKEAATGLGAPEDLPPRPSVSPPVQMVQRPLPTPPLPPLPPMPPRPALSSEPVGLPTADRRSIDVGAVEVLAVAADAALAAGQLLRADATGSRKAAQTPTSPGAGHDLYSECEALIRGVVQRAFPDHEFASAAPLVPSSRWTWVLEPLSWDADEVTEMTTVSIMACRDDVDANDNNSAVAAVYDPWRDELFTTVRGRGVELNGLPLRVPEPKELRNAVVGAESSADAGCSRASLRALYSLSAPAAKGVQVLANAKGLAWVACGRIDAFYALSGKGTGAGALLVREAGGFITDFDGEPWQGASAMCATSSVQLNGELREVLVQAGVKGPDQTS
ncbi:unnamed protein product, partial [Polarella glacialis]